MHILFLLDVLFTHLVIITAVGSWPSNDDSLFFGSDSALDTSALSANELNTAPSDRNELPSLFGTDSPPETSELGSSGLPLWDLNDDPTLGPSFNDVGVDNNFKLADCSASGELPLFSKSRVRRNDNLGVCQPKLDDTPAIPGGINQLDFDRIEKAIDNQLGPIEKIKETSNTEDQNQFCFLLTAGSLPWGVCSSGDLADELLVVVDPIMINGFPQALAYTLKHCTLCTLIHLSLSILFLKKKKQCTISWFWFFTPPQIFPSPLRPSFELKADFRSFRFLRFSSPRNHRSVPRSDSFLLQNLQRHRSGCLFAAISIHQIPISSAISN